MQLYQKSVPTVLFLIETHQFYRLLITKDSITSGRWIYIQRDKYTDRQGPGGKTFTCKPEGRIERETCIQIGRWTETGVQTDE